MSKLKHLTIGFVIGFLIYGFLDRILNAVNEKNLRSNIRSCQLTIGGFLDADQSSIESLMESGHYAHLNWSQEMKDSLSSNGIIFPIAYDRSIESHGGDGISILLSNGKIIWDQNAIWLGLFFEQHGDKLATNVPALVPIVP